AHGPLDGHAHRHQHVRRLHVARGARRSRRHGDALEIQTEDDGFRLDVTEHDVRGTRQAVRQLTVQPAVRYAGTDTLPQPIAGRRQPRRLVGHLAGPDLDRLAKADDAGGVLRPGPAAPFVLAAVLDGEHLRPPADVERGHALGPVDLVSGEGHETDTHRVHVDGDLSEGLNGVDVQRHPALARDGPDLGDRLDRTDLAVGVHDTDR